MKLTKKAEAILKKWGTTVRPNSTTIAHMVHQRLLTVEPVPFAVYEAGTKAVYASWFNLTGEAAKLMNAEQLEGHKRWYAELAKRGGFTLPEITPKMDPKAAAEDYRYCVSLLQKAGLYHDLMD